MDTIAQFLTRIRNAGMARQEKIDIGSSSMRVALAEILREAGYIRNFKVVRDGKQGMMRVYLKYNEKGEHAISHLSRVSRSGLRRYVKSTQIPIVRSGYGACILSTNQGVMKGEDALKHNIGGELLCTIW